MRESHIERHLANCIKLLGGLCWKFTSPNLAGVPDRIVVMPGGRVFFVELKAPGQKPRANQQRRARELMQRGVMTVTLDSIDAVNEWVSQFCEVKTS